MLLNIDICMYIHLFCIIKAHVKQRIYNGIRKKQSAVMMLDGKRLQQAIDVCNTKIITYAFPTL